MDIFEKQSKEIYNLLTEYIKPKANKVKINEILLVNICSICKFVSAREDFHKDQTRFDSVIIRNSNDNNNNNDEGKQKRVKGNELIFNDTLEISRIDNGLNNNNKNNNIMRFSIGFEESIKNNTFDEDGKFNQLKMNESQFDLISEKEDVSSIHDIRGSKISMQSTFLEGFDKVNNSQRKDVIRESKDNSFSNDSSRISKEINLIKDSINGELNDKQIREITKEMNGEYILDLYSIYQAIRKYAMKSIEVENIIFVNRFKQFLLEEKRLYEQCIRLIIYNKDKFKFYDFHLCIQKVLTQKYEYNFLKYKLLYYLNSRKDVKEISTKELEKYMILLKSNRIYDYDIYNRINTKLMDKYKEIYPNHNLFEFKKLSLVLDLFFNIK